MNTLTTLAITNYRSLRNLILPLTRLTAITGPNGSGKSNIYRALRLLAGTARGQLAQSLALEVGLHSALLDLSISAKPNNFSRLFSHSERYGPDERYDYSVHPEFQLQYFF